MKTQPIITSSPTETTKCEYHGDITTAPTSMQQETKFKLKVSSIDEAVAAYRDFPECPLKELSEKFGISAAVIVYHARKAGLPKRKRGRPAMLQPTTKHRQIFELVRNFNMAEAARQSGVSRQYVHSLIRHRAAELIKRRDKKNTVTPSPCRQSRPSRDIVVSFRLSNEELNRLSAMKISSKVPLKSTYDKARAIVLAQITDADNSVYNAVVSPTLAASHGQNARAEESQSDLSDGASI